MDILIIRTQIAWLKILEYFMKKEPFDSGNIKQTQLLNLSMLRLRDNHPFLNEVKNMGNVGYSFQPYYPEFKHDLEVCDLVVEFYNLIR